MSLVYSNEYYSKYLFNGSSFTESCFLIVTTIDVISTVAHIPRKISYQ